MRKAKALALSAVLLFALSSCNSNVPVSPAPRSPTLPYKDLSASEIHTVTVKIPPRGFRVELSDDEVEELAAILRTVETGKRPDAHTQYEGEATTFTLAKVNGAVGTITVHKPVIFVNDFAYETDDCDVLSEFGKRVAESAYQQFQEKTAGSVRAFSDSATEVSTGRMVTIRMDENQSLPF